MRNFERFQRLKQIQGNLNDVKNPFEFDEPPSIRKSSRKRYKSKEKPKEQLNIRAVKVNLPGPSTSDKKKIEVHPLKVNAVKSSVRSPKTVELSF
mmetsp:Transcript_38981/g.59270  ORF Transcript_38981/g.59270 Transcript_38981/m.59270 type:complete len:95 (+) Transcript_38981:1846-2130(+)